MAGQRIDQHTPTVQQYLPIAEYIAYKLGTDPRTVLGQMMAESAWGQSDLARNHNNLWGLESQDSNNPHRVRKMDNQAKEERWYWDFPTSQEGADEYIRRINKFFPQAVGNSDPRAYATGLQNGVMGAYKEKVNKKTGKPYPPYENTLADMYYSVNMRMPTDYKWDPQAYGQQFEKGQVVNQQANQMLQQLGGN